MEATESMEPSAFRALALEIRGGIGSLELGVLPERDGPYRASREPYEVKATGTMPRVEFDGERVRIRPDGGALAWLVSMGERLDVRLARTASWDVSIGGVAGMVRANLSAVPIARFDVFGGIGDAELALGIERHPCHVAIRGGARRLVITRPADVPVRVVGHGGIHMLRVDTLKLGDVGGMFQWETPGLDRALPYLDLEIQGGMEELVITPEEGASL
jgi:hypothetical protein